jgi:hypothetical protein
MTSSGSQLPRVAITALTDPARGGRPGKCGMVGGFPVYGPKPHPEQHTVVMRPIGIPTLITVLGLRKTVARSHPVLTVAAGCVRSGSGTRRKASKLTAAG